MNRSSVASPNGRVLAIIVGWFEEMHIAEFLVPVKDRGGRPGDYHRIPGIYQILSLSTRTYHVAMVNWRHAN